jgi:hypothetical protein
MIQITVLCCLVCVTARLESDDSIRFLAQA